MNNSRILYLVSFIEGGALMAAELISAKLLGPYYGSSLIVWTSVLICTLSGLAIGYYFGGKLSTNDKKLNLLLKILIFSTLYFIIMSPLSHFIMENTLFLPIEIGSLLSIFIFLFPILVAFGMVSPIVISILTIDLKDSGKNSGNIYTISTLGGVVLSLFSGFYAIPILGLKISIFISSFLLLLACTLVYFILKKQN